LFYPPVAFMGNQPVAGGPTATTGRLGGECVADTSDFGIWARYRLGADAA
jgi:hypothetical protein